jgi:mono/diheme cytochrome c family protein
MLKPLSLVCAFSVLMFSHSAFAELSADTGKQDFLLYCSSCHGVDGKGGGPMALSTPAKPKDLTVLSQANGGVFPYVVVRKIIDGRHDTGLAKAHIKGDMPVWGDVFTLHSGKSVPAKVHADAVAKMRILNIVDYLVSIQEQCVGDCL